MKKKKTKREPWRLRWQYEPLKYAGLVHGDDKLVFTVGIRDRLYYIVAVESSATDIDGILDSHGHQNLGTFKSRSRAQAAATRYAKSWWTKKTRAARCACKPIRRRRHRG